MITDTPQKQSCLLIIDVQNALFEACEPSLYQSERVLKNIKSLIHRARNSKVPIIYIQHSADSGLFKRNSHTWQIHKHIAPSHTDIIVEKTSWDGFMQTKLFETLNQLHIDSLIVCGMQTEYCMDTTLRRAYSLGFATQVIRDAHTTFDSDILIAKDIIRHHNLIWNGRFAEIIAMDELKWC